jgi:hypothetical protein
MRVSHGYSGTGRPLYGPAARQIVAVLFRSAAWARMRWHRWRPRSPRGRWTSK